MLAYLALYVLFGVFRRARARCELEHHAHDIYDAFHAVHAGRVKHSTFFFLEELISIVEASHGTARDQAQLRPIAGHDVQVSCLWQVRDFWEWMAPGYTKKDTREHALLNAAFSSFSAFRGYRDFLLELESDSKPANPRVGLWAKAYMTTSDYEFLGTIITMESYQAITRDRSNRSICAERRGHRRQAEEAGAQRRRCAHLNVAGRAAGAVRSEDGDGRSVETDTAGRG